MMLFSLTASAKDITVNVYWPFAAGSQQANMIRSLLDSANVSQTKYRFLFVHKPGAGGSIAANSSLTDNGISLLASTSSFYIRPMLYEQSHDIEKFNLISTICVEQPLGIFTKNQNLLLDAEHEEITLGVIPGSITTLLVRSLIHQNPNLKILEVPFKSTPDATFQMLGEHISGSVDFINKGSSLMLDDSVHVIGVSGVNDNLDFKTFENQGINGLSDIVNDYYIFSPNHLDSNIVEELRNIFNNSISPPVRLLCEESYGYIKTISADESIELHTQNIAKWKNLTDLFEKK